MQVSVDRLESSKVKVNIEVEAERVNQAFNKAYVKVRGQVRIPGFRPGKAPRPVLEAHIGREALVGEALELLLPDAYGDALEQAGLEPVDRPEIDVQDFEENAPFSFSAEVMVRPEVVIDGYRGLAAERSKAEISDEALEQEIESLRLRLATWEEEEGARAAEGDRVNIDFQGSLDGRSFDGGSGQGVVVQIGAGRFLKEMEDALVGAAAGEELKTTVNFPEDYHHADLAGQAAEFSIRTNSIMVRRLPAIDEEFVKKISASQNVDDFRRELREHLRSDAEREAENRMRSDLVGKAAELARTEIPDIMIDDAVKDMIREMEMRLRYQGLGLQQFLQSTERDMAGLEKEFRPEAEKRVRSELALDAIAAREELQLSEEEMQSALADLARSYGREPEQLKDEMSPDRLRELRRRLLRDKAVDFLTTNAEIKEVD